MSDIYNKNAREAHLMAEAYTNIYKEEFNPRRDAPEHSEGAPHPAQRAAESIIGAEVMWDGMMKRGQVDEVDLENGVAVVYDEDGGEHIVQLGDFDVVNTVEDNESRAERADVDRYEYEQGKKAAYDSEAHAYRDRADKYKAKDARDSIKVGNLYKGESYHELVIGIKGDEVYTDKGNRYDINQMLDELEYVDTIDFDFLNEIL